MHPADRLFNLIAAGLQKPNLALVVHQPTLHRLFSLTAKALYRRAKNTQTRLENVGGVPCRWMIPARDCGKTLFYLHGGGFTIGSPETHQHLAARLADTLGARALLPRYRRAPAHPFPAAINDVRDAYRALLAKGTAPQDILLAGDSAGGNLALGLLSELTAEERPAGLFLIGPVANASETRALPKGVRDKLLPRAWIGRAMRAYKAPADDPRSNALATALPAIPTLIHVAEGEVLAPDGQAIAEHFKASGADVEMASYENVTHVFHLHAGWSPTADRAIADVGAWAHRTFWSNEA